MCVCVCDGGAAAAARNTRAAESFYFLPVKHSSACGNSLRAQAAMAPASKSEALAAVTKSDTVRKKWAVWFSGLKDIMRGGTGDYIVDKAVRDEWCLN